MPPGDALETDGDFAGRQGDSAGFGDQGEGGGIVAVNLALAAIGVAVEGDGDAVGGGGEDDGRGGKGGGGEEEQENCRNQAPPLQEFRVGLPPAVQVQSGGLNDPKLGWVGACPHMRRLAWRTGPTPGPSPEGEGRREGETLHLTTASRM